MLEKTKILIIYLVAINVVTFFVYGLDKLKAKRREWRIPEAVLIALFFLVSCGTKQKAVETPKPIQGGEYATPVLLPGKSHGWRSLVGRSPWGH